MKCPKKMIFLTAGLWLAVSASAFAIDPDVSKDKIPVLTAESQHQIAGKRIASRFTQSHYKQIKLDQTFANKVLDRYLNQLDYSHNVFTEADVKTYHLLANNLAIELKNGDSELAYQIYNESMKKRYDRLSYALSLLDNEITFTTDESIDIDRSKAPWAKNEAALDELWRKRVKYDALSLKLAGKKWPEIKKVLAKRYQMAIKRLTQSHSEDVFQLYMNAFAREIDPHTSYLSPRNAEQFQSEINLSLEGIGAVLQMTDDYTVIRSLVTGGPAAKSKKLKDGDRIIGVAQAGEPMVDVIGWRLDDVVELIKGRKGSKVILDILPEGKDVKSYTVELVRDKIRLEDRAVKSKVITEGKDKIGVLEVPSFYVGLTKDTEKELAKLKKDKVKAIIVDLRNNGGGALTEAISLSGLFIPDGPVVQVRDSYDRVVVNGNADHNPSYIGPLLVLINRYSASASEIFAAAMQDYGRAVIVGENSYGKGTVQQHRSLNQIYDLFAKELGYVQYTIQKFYRINGGSTQNLGVIPDIAYPTTVDPKEAGESVEDNALPWDSIPRANYKVLSNNQSLVKELTAKHKKRISADREFIYIDEDIVKVKKEKDVKTISLNESVRRKEMKENDDTALQRINARQKAEKKKPFADLDAVPKTYEAPDVYLDETVHIADDMVQ